ncbi:intercellular trafficking and secretion [Pyricularia oryzae]|uniref:Sorting nexin-4 n=5 Tax=Pyricularia TaxID=48558 RepID=SNX4_PYRO7|nr:sorting nexin-4 [Pyricularia oryzae 70-15]Q522W5.1 RecName: Full=Sorting nexin-4; AltName: Full=Autophagy-related protein 24 [Pyricularia oryzae 70-15]ELQ44014.1 autophagy-related protein 24 [Pyricularia oryzae Y34]KAH8844334.1 intercellular trafficking and secretion [Pyricularia oryzae]KAI6290752.1 intercellular trafficking and secretion [Pyricularia grisea]EHA49932.1 sorting nexin-4 [Pyricularia oryzae 70-15]KAH9431845.1 intercellular trafficking and secretion [Pyricularia oryzae]
MGGIDQDNFSNISWQSDRLGAGSSAAHQHGGQESEQPTHNQAEPEPNYTSMIVHGMGLGDEVLECNVSSPLKENDGTKDAFVSYLVTTHTTFADFQKPDASVRRRFTDFVFLFKTLSREYPASAVPPLPDKQRMEYVRGDRFGNDFTSRRAYSLRRFLARCALHPVLRRSAILHTFLESPDWNATMRSRASRSVSMSGTSSGESGNAHYGGGSAGGGSTGGGNSLANSVFDNFADTFINAFTKVHKPDRRFIEVREKSDKLDEDLAHVEKVVARVSRRETDMEADHKDLAEQFQKLIVLEPGVEGPVRAFAASVEDTAQGLRGLREATEQDYLGSLRDLAAYSGALKNLLKAREQKQLDFEQLTEYLNKSSAERDVLASGGYSSGGALAGAGGFIRSKIEDVRGVDHEQSRRERLRKLELRIEELTVEVERAKKTSELFDEEVIREVSDFERIKRIELKRQFGSLAQSHTDFYDATIDVWEKYVKEMEKEGAVAA